MRHRRIPNTIKRMINGVPVRVRLSDGYINMEDFERALGHPSGTFEAYLKTPEAQSFLKQLSAETGRPLSRLVQREGPTSSKDV